MKEEINSILEQLNRLAKIKTGTDPQIEDMSDVINYMSENMTGTNPKKQTVAKALKYYVDNYRGGGNLGLWGQIFGDINNQTDLINKINSMIQTELAVFERLQYKVADSIPTPTTVVIGGQTVPTEEGIRYLYKPTGQTAYDEYVLIDGVIYKIGTTEEIDLTNYYNKSEIDLKLVAKADKVDVPTKVSELENDANYVTKDYVDELIRLMEEAIDAINGEVI